MSYSYKDGRIWVQRKKFVAFELFLLGGLTDVTDPRGTLNAVREPSPAKRRESLIADIVRGEPDLPTFRIDTRLASAQNYMLGLRQAINIQAHMGSCDRPDNYNESQIGMFWNRCFQGDVGIDRMAIIEGDNGPSAVAVPWSARWGPTLVDFTVSFISAQTITETEAIKDIAFLPLEILEECQSQEDAGENGYAVTGALVGSPLNVANVWGTTDKGKTWAEVSSRPFGGGEDISCVVVSGRKNDHRIIVSRGTTDAANPAEIAYADVTAFGTTTWVNVDVGAVDGQYIKYMFWLNWGRLCVVTDDGYVYSSKDGGATWEAIYTAATYELNDVVMGSDGTIWVVGNTGTILYSINWGEDWTTVTPPTGWAATNITSISMCPDGAIIIGNNSGAVAGSYDNGDEWTVLVVQGVTPASIPRIRAYSNDIICLVVTLADSTSRVLKSTDGGATFRLWSLNMPTNSGINALCIIDQNVMYAGGEPQGSMAFITKTKTNLYGY